MNIVTKISKDLCLREEYINNIISKADFFYKDYKIFKFNGGFRLISQAGAELKTLQYWVVKNIFSKFPISDFAFAYKKGSSIKKHARYHLGAQHILHLDVKKFFPSIKSRLLDAVLEKNQDVFKLLDIDFRHSISIIDKICFRSDILCIGTVSSPVISNIVMFEFDNILSEYCKSKEMKYSRYSDDIYISSNKFIDNNVIDFVSKELKKYDMRLNNDKTRFISKNNRKRVTGLIITDKQKISIGKNRKDEIKKELYEKLVKGIGDAEHILGLLAFLKDVEPHYYDRLIIKYSKYCKGDMIESLVK